MRRDALWIFLCSTGIVGGLLLGPNRAGAG
jgi:hypothetical protein